MCITTPAITSGIALIEIQPQMSDKPGDESGPTQKVVGYKVSSDLKVRLSAFGMPSRLTLVARVFSAGSWNWNAFGLAPSSVKVAGGRAAWEMVA